MLGHCFCKHSQGCSSIKGAESGSRAITDSEGTVCDQGCCTPPTAPTPCSSMKLALFTVLSFGIAGKCLLKANLGGRKSKLPWTPGCLGAAAYTRAGSCSGKAGTRSGACFGSRGSVKGDGALMLLTAALWDGGRVAAAHTADAHPKRRRDAPLPPWDGLRAPAVTGRKEKASSGQCCARGEKL